MTNQKGSASSNRSKDKVGLRLPVIVIVLAATAVPIEWRPQGHNSVDVWLKLGDAVTNVAGYVPVGIVLGELGVLPAIIAAALMTTLAESLQLVMMYRDPSVMDVASNVVGAILGIMVSRFWRIRTPGFTMNKRTALAALALAVILVAGVWATRAHATNARGVTAPGTLEAHWTFDEDGGRVAMDSSGHGLHGRFVHEPVHVAGVLGKGVQLDSASDFIYVDQSTELRLVGSMTVSAWIKSKSYPRDDAAIVSTLKHVIEGAGSGFQFDTTIDTGPRTISFKLADSCGVLMARYGATPLRLDTWYHVAGVYDARAETINVYLNGELDNGSVLGTVTGDRRSSREALHIGTRSDLEGFFPFTGVIDDVRIYSRALTKAEIEAVMRGANVDGPGAQVAAEPDLDGGSASRPGNTRRSCDWSSEFEDARIPGAVAVFGVLLAVACIGLWPSGRSWQWLVVCLLAGWLLLPVASGTLPPLNVWTFPLTSLAGGVSVVFSLRRRIDPARHAAE